MLRPLLGPILAPLLASLHSDGARQTFPFEETIMRLEAFDIWEGFSGAAVGGTWDATSYAAWIAGVDARFAGNAIKTDRGVCSDGITHIYSYTAGNGPAVMLLNAGMHGDERLGMYAAMRWFDAFVRSSHPVMAALRRALTVIWIPTLNPSGYATSRKNANDVDINRNFGFYWGRYTPEGTEYNKGSSAFSEVESQLIKSIIDNENVCVFVDCHNMGAGESPDTLKISPPSSWALGKRAMVYGAARGWAEAYDGTWSEIDVPRNGNPNGYSWASYYFLWNKARYNGATVLVECNSDAQGSTANTVLSKNAARSYCGFITSFLLAWIAEGQNPPQPYPVTWHGRRANNNDAVSITAGGTLIDTTTQTALTFDEFTPTGGNAPRAYLDCLYLCPGGIKIYADGYIEGGGTTATRVDLFINIDGVQASSSPVSVSVPAAATQRTPFVLSHRISIASLDGTTIPRITLTAARVGAGDNTKLKRYRIWAEFTPNSDLSPVPNVN